MAFSFAPAGSSTAGPSASLFGNTAQHNQAPKPAFSFGAPAPAQAQSSQPSQPAGSAFSFGQSSQAQQQPSASASTPAAGQGQGQGSSFGGFGFGQNQSGQAQSQAAGQSTTSAPAPGTSLFGGGGGAFGSSISNQQPAQSGLGAGSTSTGGAGLFSSFNQNQTQPQQPQLTQPSQAKPLSLFGQSQGGPQTLGATSTGLFGQSQGSLGQQSQPQQQQQQVDKRLGPSLSARLAAVHQAWDSNNLQTCRFLHYFYVPVPNDQLHFLNPQPGAGGGSVNSNFGRRSDAVGPRHEELWRDAVNQNPNPRRLVPVLAVGFNELKSRADAQQSEAARQRQLVSQLREKAAVLAQSHTLKNTTRTSAALRRQVALHHRLISSARKAAALLPPSASQPGQSRSGSHTGAAYAQASVEDEQLRSRLEQCEAEIRNGKLKSRVNELWAALGAVKARAGARSGSASGSSGTAEWAVVDPEALDEVARILGSQQKGLNHLVATVENDTQVMNTILKGLSGVQLTGVRGPQYALEDEG
ncbi:Nuclear pore complex, p54 component (sc Nup57) [Ceraceosorus bombacis]|uniref:Nuclear pore complex, p54 component (Sc Nup57) n=1 Tax=Ceraceosorus bombacis TaxID=401625 RepID=A0A0P1BDQ4_9BASI|nr:Nuclear pore complex, p54 component (sc Nup57) [Ceraceosorus bombacis]